MHDRHLRALIAGAAGLVVAAPAAQAQTRRVSRVGVVVAVHVNMSEEDAQALGDQIGDGLRDALVIDVVAGAQAARLLPPGGVGELCVARPACVKDTGQRLDADQLLFLAVVRLGKRVQVEPTWTDAGGTQSASRDTIVLDAGTSARETFAGAATRLLPDITVRSRTQAEQPSPPAAAQVPTASTAPAAPAAGELGVTAAGPAPRRRIHTGTWIAGGIAAAALAGGIGFGLAARSAKNDLENDECGTTRRCDPSRIDSLENRMLWADVFYATAAVAAGAAVFIQLRWGGRAEPAPVSVAPTAGGGAAVLLRGAF